MSGEQNRFEFRDLRVFLHAYEPMPDEVCFGELVHRISLTGDVSLVAWSEGTGSERQWILNPKDKTTKRTWADEDELVVIRRAAAYSNPPILTQPHTHERFVHFESGSSSDILSS